jgi:hypothetical protein
MAEIRFEMVDKLALDQPGVTAEAVTLVGGVRVSLVVGWSPRAGVFEWWVACDEQSVDVSAWLNPALAQELAAAALAVLAGERSKDRPVEWSPEVQWGIGISPLVDRLSEHGAHVLRDEAEARAEARVTGRPLVARLAAGPWVVVPND